MRHVVRDLRMLITAEGKPQENAMGFVLFSSLYP